MESWISRFLILSIHRYYIVCSRKYPGSYLALPYMVLLQGFNYLWNWLYIHSFLTFHFVTVYLIFVSAEWAYKIRYHRTAFSFQLFSQDVYFIWNVFAFIKWPQIPHFCNILKEASLWETIYQLGSVYTRCKEINIFYAHSPPSLFAFANT